MSMDAFGCRHTKRNQNSGHPQHAPPEHIPRLASHIPTPLYQTATPTYTSDHTRMASNHCHHRRIVHHTAAPTPLPRSQRATPSTRMPGKKISCTARIAPMAALREPTPHNLLLHGRDGGGHAGTEGLDVGDLAVLLSVVHDPAAGGGPAAVALEQQVVRVAVAVLVRGGHDAEEALLTPWRTPAVTHDPAAEEGASAEARVGSACVSVVRELLAPGLRPLRSRATSTGSESRNFRSGNDSTGGG